MSAAPDPRPGPRRAALWALLIGSGVLLALLDWGDDPRRRAPGVEPSGAADTEPAPVSAVKRARDRVPLTARDRSGVAPVPVAPAPSPSPGLAPSTSPAQPPAARVTPECRKAGEYGRCEGNVAHACIDSQLISVDCAARNERCVMTGEGASCLPKSPRDCEPNSTMTCRGDHLRHCVDGRMEELDCSLMLARCVQHGQQAGCVSDASPDVSAATAPAKLELCDQKDNDDDTRIDEGNVCSPVPLAAFVPKGANLRNQAERMQTELAILNRMYAPTVFSWREPIEVDAKLRAFNPKELDELASELALRMQTVTTPTSKPGEPVKPPPRFYIPVLFSETIVGSPPKVGISTLPNSRCGGVRVSQHPAPIEGVVVVSDRRRPETLAHEVGHYLGLCHTHMELTDYVPASAASPDCDAAGDGICDTPLDPGPDRCAELEDCSLVCSEGAQPDSSNVMSYYMGCRTRLSSEQLTEAQRNLTLRRGWSECLNPDGCTCTPGASGGCPEEMSCSPSAEDRGASGSCILDGPALPGAPCEAMNMCSQQSTCIRTDSSAARCARMCSANSADCTCSDMGLPFRICREDVD